MPIWTRPLFACMALCASSCARSPLDVGWTTGTLRFSKHYAQLACALAIEVQDGNEEFMPALERLGEEYFIIHAEYDLLDTIWIVTDNQAACSAKSVGGLNVLAKLRIDDIPRLREATPSEFAKYDSVVAQIIDTRASVLKIALPADEGRELYSEVFQASAELGFPEVISHVETDEIIMAIDERDQKRAIRIVENFFRMLCQAGKNCTGERSLVRPASPHELLILRKDVAELVASRPG